MLYLIDGGLGWLLEGYLLKVKMLILISNNIVVYLEWILCKFDKYFNIFL